MKHHVLAIVIGLGALVPARADSPAGNSTATAPDTASASPDGKLKSIVLSVNFYNATLAEAANYLRVESRVLDPEHKGFSVVISPDTATSAKTITLELNQVTLLVALQNVCDIAGVKYQLEGNVIHFLSLAEDPAVAAPVLPPDNKAAEATMQKLQGIVIDRLIFEKLDITAVVQFLAQKSKELDPDHRGVNFVAIGGIATPSHINREVTLTLENVPLSDVLRYIAQQTNLNYSIGDNIVTFKP